MSEVIRMPISKKKNWKVPLKIIGGHPLWSEKNLSGLGVSSLEEQPAM